MPTKKTTKKKAKKAIPLEEGFVLVLDRSGGLLTFRSRDGKTIECPIKSVQQGWSMINARRLYSKINDDDLEEAVSDLFGEATDVIFALEKRGG